MKLTEQQRDNLATLARELLTVDQRDGRFDMAQYQSRDDGYSPIYAREVNDCGTAACAIGWSPTLVTPALHEESWSRYCVRVFGVDTFSEEFNFMFSEMWRYVDNSPSGASKRITYFLEHGVPEIGSEFDLDKLNDFKKVFAASNWEIK